MVRALALSGLVVIIGQCVAAPAAMVDCKAANDDCAVCTSMDYCQFVVT